MLSYSAGAFLVGIDLMVTAMLTNFLLMTLSVLNLARRNPELASKIRFMRSRTAQIVVAGTGAAMLATLIGVQIVKDGRVALGSYPPRAPTDPDVHDSRIRLV